MVLNKIERLCGFCGTAFLAWPHEIRDGKAKFCSRQCFGKMPRVYAKRPSKRVPRTCETCDKHFSVKPSEANDGDGKYCSRDCYNQGKKISISRLFLRSVGPVTRTGCMPWTGTHAANGYGVFGTRFGLSGGKATRILAHRFAFEFAYGPIHDGMQVLHLCDRRNCVNPLHLAIGTQTENNADKVAKGRHCKGEQCHFTKLTEAAVKDIRARYAAGQASQIQLAKEYGVGNTNISHIIRRLSWRHVK